MEWSAGLCFHVFFGYEFFIDSLQDGITYSLSGDSSATYYFAIDKYQGTVFIANPIIDGSATSYMVQYSVKLQILIFHLYGLF